MINAPVRNTEMSAPVSEEMQRGIEQYERELAAFNDSPVRQAAAQIAACTTGIGLLGVWVASPIVYWQVPNAVIAYSLAGASASCIFLSACADSTADVPVDPRDNAESTIQ